MTHYRVPLRVSFIGGALDHPTHIGPYRGTSVCCSIDRFMSVSITEEGIGVYPPCDFIEKLLVGIAEGKRHNVNWKADIPLGSGLGGSAALMVAVAKHFLSDPFKQATAVGQVEIMRGSGWQDGAIAAHPGCHVFYYESEGYMLAKSLESPDRNYFMLLSSGTLHDSSVQWKDRKPMDVSTIYALNALNDAGVKALKAKNYEKLGALMNEAYIFKSENPNYTFGSADGFLREARNNGAYGGKILGSGGGGHFLLAIDPKQRGWLRYLAEEYGYTEVDFNFL